MKKNIFTKALYICLFLFVTTFIFTSCATTNSKPKATLTQRNERMFWEINGIDAQGNPSTVFIQGTFHLADERVFPIADNVLVAWAECDRLVGEISTEGWANYNSSLQNRIMASSLTGGQNVKDDLTKEELDFINNLIGEEMVNQLSPQKPWILTTILDQILLQSTGFNLEYGYDMNFIAFANQYGKYMEGLDDLELQLDLIEYGTREDQIMLLKDTIKGLQDIESTLAELFEMYEAFVNDDRVRMGEITDSSIEKSIAENKNYQNYYEEMFTNRNKDWAKKIESYLNEGGTTFIFAGCGHFTGKNNVFDFMKKNGTIN